MSIRPLPDEVVAQIKSSTAIVSLTGVVLELLKNSLDARASKIDVTVDFARGGCTIEDDGLGIAPAEFREDGGLGKLYCTSKYQSDEPHFGQHGTFLASLSAMSLLTITSHHYAYRSHNSISFHHSQAIERQTPTTAHDHVHGKHGTRVTVRNLFGNMPVRVKQRSLVMDQKAEHHRLRGDLKNTTVGLLLSWQRPIALKIRDGDNKIIVNFNTSHAAAAGDNQGAATGRPHSAHLSSLLHILTQAGYIGIDEWASWVPASASTAVLSIKGAISLEPSPSKHVQFMSFGLRPLFSNNGHNELYDQVNRLFALSSFGILEDDADIDDQEKLRRQSDRRFKNDGYTNRQLKARKGVDRYPMFHLQISVKDGRISDSTADRFVEDETNLQAVVEVLDVMISQWLSVHHFRPRKHRQKSDESRTVSTPIRESDKENCLPSRKRESLSRTPTNSAPTTNVRPKTANAAKRKRLAVFPPEDTFVKPRQQAFAEWSRIKSGKSSFFDSATPTGKSRTDTFPRTRSTPTSEKADSQPLHAASQQQNATFNSAPISRGALSDSAITVSSEPKNDTASTSYDTDEIVMWTDPSTSKTHLLNARTGCMVAPQRARPETNSAARMPVGSEASISKSLRMTPRSAPAESTRTPWLDGVMQGWENPVFKLSEKSIERMSLQNDLAQGQQQHAHMHCTHLDMRKAFNESTSSSARLSKDGLRSAQVVSQVDKKFILVKMMGSLTGSEMQSTTEVLVLVDQHAADERVQVETLLADLCNPNNDDLHPVYQSKLGLSSPVAFVSLEKPLKFTISRQEHTHFRLHAANFAAWGILYDISSFTSPGSRPGAAEQEIFGLSVTTLPPSISGRCKGDPQPLISFLRSAVWKYAESPPVTPAVANDQHRSWVARIATCPPGLIDLINSRACRSAIMFNDELSLEECRVLLARLADCVFPFMCAHGRPSMVPIADLQCIGRVGDESEPGPVAENNQTGGFVEAWKKWKTRTY